MNTLDTRNLAERREALKQENLDSFLENFPHYEEMTESFGYIDLRKKKLNRGYIDLRKKKLNRGYIDLRKKKLNRGYIDLRKKK